MRNSTEQRRRPPTRSRWPGCAGGSGVVLELLQLASATRPTASMMSTPTRNLQVCRHPCTSALTRMLACHMRLCLGRLFYTLNGYGVEFIHPEACLVVLVAGQRSQASLATSAAMHPLAREGGWGVAGPPCLLGCVVMHENREKNRDRYTCPTHGGEG